MAHEQILEGKTAFITGAGSGIGRALAVGFAKYGTDIILAGRNEAKMIETQELITAQGRQTLITIVDVQKYEDFVRAFQAAKEKFGRIDILINNAGYSRLYPFTHPKCTQEILDNIVKTNVLGPLYGSHAVLPFMIEQGGGTILSTGSTIIDQPAPGWTAYSMSKSSLTGFTECLATELTQKKINVNLIMPRMVRTPMLRGMKEDLINSMNPMQPEEL
ncbi:MAG: SDR family NAD(P)-dependent oxidoreductase, partial [Promethearchaeota archaeon]